MAKQHERFLKNLRRMGDAQGVSTAGPRERRATPRKLSPKAQKASAGVARAGISRDPGPKAKFEQKFKQLQQQVTRQATDAADPGRRRSFPSKVAAATGQAPRAGRRAVPSVASRAAKFARVSPVGLAASALLQPRTLGDATRGTPMNTPEQVRRINAQRRLRKQRSIPRSMRRGLR